MTLLINTLLVPLTTSGLGVIFRPQSWILLLLLVVGGILERVAPTTTAQPKGTLEETG